MSVAVEDARAEIAEGAPLLSLEDVTITYRGADGRRDAVRNVSLAIRPREAYGVVGESGSGKSTLAYAAIRYLPANGRVSNGRILFEGRDVLALSRRELQRVRGGRIAMVYQDPGAALNPAMTVGEQVAEVYRVHGGLGTAGARRAAVEMLDRVRMPGAAAVAARYPHQLSGGMQQRAIIAMALATNPALLILDEPTTGLDATVEAAVLDLIAALRAEFDAAILFISHNLAVVARVCDRVGVLYAGELVEQGPTAQLFAAPRHPYTAGLIACVPRQGARKGVAPLIPIAGRMPRPGEEGPGCLFAPRCPLARQVCRDEHPPLIAVTPRGEHPPLVDVQPGTGRMPALPVTPHGERPPLIDGIAAGSEHLSRCFFWPDVRVPVAPSAAGDEADEAAARGQDGTGVPDGVSTLPLLAVAHAARRFGPSSHPVRAVDDVSLEVGRGQIFGLVGESGSGKSTLARCVAGLLALSAGRLTLDGADISREVEHRDRASVRGVQMVFQSPAATLNPHQTVRQILGRAVRGLTARRGREAEQRVAELAALVGLDPALLDRRPEALSGGQRQRVAIARAFAGDPRVVLCDEPVSNLDVSVQAAVLNLLGDLQQRRQVSYVFISHDLGVVRYLADTVGVMYLGQLVEVGPVGRVFAPPFHPYTETLFAAMPTIEAASARTVSSPVLVGGGMPSAADIPAGCPFHTRCPRSLGEQCRTAVPPWQQTAEGHAYRCWIPPTELAGLQNGE